MIGGRLVEFYVSMREIKAIFNVGKTHVQFVSEWLVLVDIIKHTMKKY